MEAELLSHRAALEKVSLDAENMGLGTKYAEVEQRWKCTLDRTSSMKQRLELDVARWRNLSGHLEELAAWAVSRNPNLDIVGDEESQSLQQSLQRRADDCGLLMVELEAKTPVMSQALESSSEALESFEKLSLTEEQLDPPTRAVLDNLRDRRRETSAEWETLKTNVEAWRAKIYQKLDACGKLDEKIQIITEICDRAEEDKGVLKGPDVQVGEVYIKEMENQMNEIGESAEVLQKTQEVKTRWNNLKKDKENGKQSRPVSIIQDEPSQTNFIPKEPEELPPPKTESEAANCDMPHTPVKPPQHKSESQKKLENSVEAVHQWERQETDKGIPYYINHGTETTTWNHPRLTDLINSLKSMNIIKFSAYRTAMKLRKIQKSLALDYFKIDHMQKAFRGFSHDQTAKIDVMELAEMLFDLYAHSKQRAQQADLCLNILLNIFDPAREGEIPVICVKTGLVALCGAQLEEKYRFLFTAASGSRQQMTKKDLNQLVYSWVQIPHYLQEGAAFGGVQTDATVESAFEYRYTITTLLL